MGVRSVKVIGDMHSQRLTGGGGVCQEKEIEVSKVAPDPGDKGSAAATDVVIMAASCQAGDAVPMKVGEMMKNLKMQNLALHVELVVEKMTRACSLMYNARLQRDRFKSVK